MAQQQSRLVIFPEFLCVKSPSLLGEKPHLFVSKAPPWDALLSHFLDQGPGWLFVALL